MVGQGTYNFLPDASFVGNSVDLWLFCSSFWLIFPISGTIFTHSLAALLSTAATQLSLSVEVSSASIKRVVGEYKVETASWGSKVTLGSAVFGQARHAVLE